MSAYLDSVAEWSGAREDWRPISRWAIFGWLAFYAIFLLYAFSMHGDYLFIDSANLVVHEGGHLLFRWFGPTLCLWGGTLLQWLVPLLLAAYFFHERQPGAFVFCSFFFFENWLYTATYMADARAMALPLVTTGDSDYIEHDWNAIFSSLGVLPYDTKIAAVVRLLGWCGMLLSVAWLAARLRTTKPQNGATDDASAARGDLRSTKMYLEPSSWSLLFRTASFMHWSHRVCHRLHFSQETRNGHPVILLQHRVADSHSIVGPLH